MSRGTWIVEHKGTFLHAVKISNWSEICRLFQWLKFCNLYSFNYNNCDTLTISLYNLKTKLWINIYQRKNRLRIQPSIFKDKRLFELPCISHYLGRVSLNICNTRKYQRESENQERVERIVILFSDWFPNVHVCVHTYNTHNTSAVQ